jgi:hypothetical protein
MAAAGRGGAEQGETVEARLRKRFDGVDQRMGWLFFFDKYKISTLRSTRSDNEKYRRINFRSTRVKF